MKRYILILMFLTVSLNIFAQDNEENGNTTEAVKPQNPFVEATSLSYEVVILYDNVQPGVETLLKIYISDFRTNIPTDNASVILDISGANIVSQPVKIEPGIYESKVIFPVLQKYDMLVGITANGIEDLLAINEVDIAKQTPITIEEEMGFFEGLFGSFYSYIIIVVVIILTALLFYRLGRNNRLQKITEKKL
jgi:hypothetical protein